MLCFNDYFLDFVKPAWHTSYDPLCIKSRNLIVLGMRVLCLNMSQWLDKQVWILGFAFGWVAVSWLVTGEALLCLLYQPVFAFQRHTDARMTNWRMLAWSWLLEVWIICFLLENQRPQCAFGIIMHRFL